MAKDGMNFETRGFEEAAQRMLGLAESLDKKYAVAFTAAVAKKLKDKEKALIARGSAQARAHSKWDKPAWKAIKTKRLSKTAKSKYGAVGHRVGLFGKSWAARAVWLERGHKLPGGGRTRAFEFVQPARNAVEPQIPALGQAGIVTKLERQAKRDAAKIKASKKP